MISPVKTLTLSILLFLSTTLMMSTFYGVHDGLTRIGFPIVFLQDTSGKCFDCDLIKWFRLSYLLVDLAFFFLLTTVLIKLYRLLKRRFS